MTLIFGTFGAFSVADDFFAALAFFFLDVVFDVAFEDVFGVVRLAAAFFDDADFEDFEDFADSFDAVFADVVVAATTGLGAGVATTGAEVGEGVTAGGVAGGAAGATVPAETDVVVLLACCVPFVAPNRPAMKGFAMQS